jgi:soluble lytic murein transglycosylase-like protein
MDDKAILALLALGGVMLYASIRYEREGTAGDEESNIFYDGIDEMGALITGWPAGSSPYRQDIEAAASRYGVPALILAWLLWKESRYLPNVISGARVSRVGAMGIAQFMPATAAEELGSTEAALDPEQAIPGAARYLAKLYKATGRSWTGALAAYNWGVGNVTRRGLAAAPAETRDYYETILAKANATGGTYA